MDLSVQTEGIMNFVYSSIGPIGHNICWENGETGCLDLKMVQISKFRVFVGGFE